MSDNGNSLPSTELLARLDERYCAISQSLSSMQSSSQAAIQSLTATTAQLTRTVALLEQRVSNHEMSNADREREVERRLDELRKADAQNAEEHERFVKTLDGLRDLVSRATGGFRVVMWGLGFLVSVLVSLLVYFLTQFTHVPKP